ncbi:MAG: RluA family pseudouridine synthase [Clostridiales bacterium]|nr:RluA family pseudouridine synthase [Clostridiales bacterium]
MRIKITDSFDGRTVKDWLYKNNISRALITRLKKTESGITVNGQHATVRHILHTGDELALQVNDNIEDENEQLIPTEMPLDIIYEDDDMIALNKPAGIPTHPSLGHFTDTLANGLAYYYKSRGIPFVFRAINRLDRDTSGIVLAAKNQYAASELSSLMQSGRIHKTYIAVLNGMPSEQQGIINAPIRRREATIILREVASSDMPDAKSAITSYEVISAGENASIVRAEPVTGRTHQLRVHFAHIGTPIVGDGLYGSAETTPTELDNMIDRHALHAASLVIEYNDRSQTLCAKLPDDMQRLCSKVNFAEINKGAELLY